MGRIAELPPAVARKIAAGEVIEKPASVLRELLDNAIDSGASEIEVRLVEGGIKELTVIDNGCGMGEEDLELCILPHATSKIREAEDLYKLSTLGFRGEALSSIAACSRLQITSREEGSTQGMRISCENGRVYEKAGVPCKSGSTVSVKDLFYSIPGRKKFLKSSTGESTSCLNVFMDKAAAFPAVSFRYFTDNKLKHFLPAGTALERVKLLYQKRIDTRFLREEAGLNEGPAEINLVLTTPSTYRRDRKQIQIFINNRRIQEYALLQAVEYGYSEILPGGCFPSCFLFIKIDPAAVDFNIHPAKREVKFREIQPLRRQVIDSIKRFLGTFTDNNRYVAAAKRIENLTSHQTRITDSDKQPEPVFYKRNELPGFSFPEIQSRSANSSMQPESASGTVSQTHSGAETTFSSAVVKQASAPATCSMPVETGQAEFSAVKFTEQESAVAVCERTDSDEPVRYLQTFRNLFLLVEKADTLYIIDQHAAHERILFDSLCEPDTIQKLLVPSPLPADCREDQTLVPPQKRQSLKDCGIEIDFSEGNGWQITAVPAGISAEVSTIASIIPELPSDLFELRKKLFATIACRKAIKEGDLLDPAQAQKLAQQTLKLPQPTCPHGRPVYFSLSELELCQLVGRDTTPPKS